MLYMLGRSAFGAAIQVWTDEKQTAATVFWIIQNPVLSSSLLPKLNNLKWSLSLSHSHKQILADAN